MIGVKSPFGARENFNGRIKGVGNEKEGGDVTYTLQWKIWSNTYGLTVRSHTTYRPKRGRVKDYRSTRPNI